MKTTAILTVLLTGLAVTGFAGTTYSLPTGATDTAAESVAGAAVFSLSNISGTEVLTITLENETVNPKSDGQNITGITFGLTGLSASGSFIAGTSADLIDVSSGGVITDTTPTAGAKVNDLSHWNVATSLNDLTLSTFGSGAPIQSVAGAPNSSGVYSNGNSSFDGGGAKTPYAYETATFTIDLAGTSLTLANLSNVKLNFGTAGVSSDLVAATVVTTTPEPGTFWLLGVSVVLIGLGTQRKWARVQTRPLVRGRSRTIPVSEA
jgi:hypothetical protein